MGSDLLKLAERWKQAAGPDRELDGAIDRLIHKRPSDGDYDDAEDALWRVDNTWSGLLVRVDGFARDSFSALEYTASRDAALTLLPDNHGYAIWRVIGKKPCAAVQSPNGQWQEWCFAETEPLALVVAIARALASKDSPNG